MADIDETTGIEEDAVAPDQTTDDTSTGEESEGTTDDDGIVSLDDEPASEDAGSDDEGDKDVKDADADAEDDEGESESDDDEGPEMRAFEFGGNKLEIPADAVPPELADEIDKFAKGTWSTFTKGQQENVERTVSLDAREDAVAKISSLNGEALNTYSRGLQLRADIAQLQTVDLEPLWQSEPDRARRISDALSAKQAEYQQVFNLVGQQEAAITEAQSAEKARRVEEGIAVLNKRYKNFSTEKAPQLVKYAMEAYGMPERQANDWAVNPVMTEMAYKAMLYDQQTKAQKKPASKPAQAKPVKPIKTSGKASTGLRDPDKMSMNQLAKHLDLRTA